jgi:Flp pilus assembly protein TadG
LSLEVITMRRIFRGMPRTRRGAAAVLFALLIPLFVGFVAFSTDLAVLAVARDQLSTTADAAALAGAQQLANEYRVRGVTDLSPEITAANTQAATIGQDNNVLGQAAILNQNTANSPGAGDMIVGYLDPTNPNATLDTSAASAYKYNSVQVTASRSSTHGGMVPAFFSRLLGYTGSNVSVMSTATAQNYAIVGYQSVNNLSANLLPIVLDVTTYQDMLAGAGVATDQYTYNPTTSTVTSGPDGVYESLLYPVSAGLPGNWGTIQVGVTDNSTSTLNSQILNGISPSQLATFPNGAIQLDPTLTPPSITFTGNPGISAGIQPSLESIIGNPVTIPIYDLNGSNGSNAWYRVIQFAPVRIMSVNFQGNPKYVIVQPALVIDRTAIAGSPLPSWTSGGLIRLHLSR